MAPPRRAFSSLGILAIGVASTVAACSGRGCGSASEEQAEEAPKPKKPGVVADCERYAKTFCELYERCDKRGFDWAYADAKLCREATVAYCAYELRAPGSGDTPKLINECAEAFTKTSCDDWGTRNTPDECHPPGTRKEGEACQISAQCESYYCKTPKQGECGKCTKLPGEGDLCPDYRCKPGTLCLAGRCAKPKKEGDTCNSDFECTATTICFREKAWAFTGVCTKPVAVGAACPDPAHAYDDDPAADDDDDEGIKPLAPPKLDAGKVDARGSGGDAGDAGDAGDGGDASDADAKPPKPTSDCNRRQSDSCVKGLCVATPLLAPGDKCSGAQVCKGGYCDLGKCQSFKGPGEKCEKSSTTNPCRFPAQCVEGTCRVPDGFECDAPDKGGKSEKKPSNPLLPFR
jgi:hypothetical protein